MMELLAVEGLRTRFPTPNGTVHAVDGVSFVVDGGETIGIVGESGSGKSVLARSIMGLVPSHALVSGRVSFAGTDLVPASRAEARKIWGKEISMVFQNPLTSLNPVMRIGRQLTEVIELHLDIDRRAARRRVVDLLASVGIPEPARRARSYPHELSGGMRQRVCIAMAVACHPQLLLADEPTTALDVTMQRQILDLLTDLQADQHMAVVLITHDFGVVAGRTDRTLVMYGGRVVESGPTAALFTRPRHPYTAALLGAIPAIDQPSHTRLATIPGQPANVVDPPPMCRYARRCDRVRDRCWQEEPVPERVDADAEHFYACFFPIDDDSGGGSRTATAVTSAMSTAPRPGAAR